jgi:hypothetical protein
MDRPMSKDDRHPIDLPPNLDHDKLAEAALGILGLTRDEYGNVWKGLDWNVMNLLFEKGWIDEPIVKRQSVRLTADGREFVESFLEKHFGK